jgi:hypothetical protein
VDRGGESGGIYEETDGFARDVGLVEGLVAVAIQAAAVGIAVGGAGREGADAKGEEEN